MRLLTEEEEETNWVTASSAESMEKRNLFLGKGADLQPDTSPPSIKQQVIKQYRPQLTFVP